MNTLEAYQRWATLFQEHLVKLGFTPDEAAAEVEDDPEYYREMFEKSIWPVRVADEIAWMRDNPPA